MKGLFGIFLVLIPLVLGAQEICDNGIDDNGNGLIDLNDPGCPCNGITQSLDITHFLPNPSFENFGCCPSYWGEIGCATGWENLNQASPDFHHECNFIGPPIVNAGLVPFPDGGGVAGSIFSSDWKEYVTTCLSQPLLPGNTYHLKMHLASVPITGSGDVCNGGNVYYEPVAIKVFGNANCNNWQVPTLDCPGSVDPTWVEIGSALYSPAAQWSELEITLTPPTNIGSIMIGPPCTLPPSYASGQPCYPYFIFDGLTLEAFLPLPPVTLSVSGHPCADDLTLTAVPSAPNGTWQWYFQGEAIAGQTGPTLLISEEDYEPGVYTVRYQIGEECDLAEVTLSFVLPEPVFEEHFLCAGDTAYCAGQAYSQQGFYEVNLPSYLNCDSLVQCLIVAYPQSPLGTVTLQECGPDTIISCGETLTSSGLYTTKCTNSFGCDSLVLLDLLFLDPKAHIELSGELGCDTMVQVILNGALSTRNNYPGGLTFFQWTGPQGGFIGPTQDTVVHAFLPGEYCLVLTHGVDSFSCSDTACVTIQGNVTLPEPPVISTPLSTCWVEGAAAPFQHSPLDTGTSLQWFAQPGLVFQSQTDTSLFFTALIPGTYSICAYTENACGSSDTLCADLIFLPVHNNVFQAFTCDSMLVGSDSIFLLNQAGCDSLIIWETLFSPAFQQNQKVTLCGEGPSYSDTLVVSGIPCDSLFITEYIFIPLDTTFLASTTCDASMAGIFITTHIGVEGCDSLAIMSVSLIPADTLYDDGVTCNKAEGVIETLHYTNQYGCDSIIYRSVLYVGVDTQFVQAFSCDSSQVGTKVEIFPGPNCDTVIVVNTQWAPFTMVWETLYSCDSMGPAADTTLHINSAGCDSLHIRLWEYSHIQGQPIVTDEQCAGEQNGELTLTLVSGGWPPYQFQLNQGAWTNNPTFIGLAPGDYTVSVRDARGCTRSYSGLMVQSGQIFNVDIGPDHEVVFGAFLDLNVQSSGAIAQWFWTALAPLSCATCPSTVLGPIHGAQTVLLSVLSEKGCPGSDALQVIMGNKAIPEVYIPSSFSPNADGINDLFTVYGNDQVVRVRNLAIYDRWGNALFSKTDLPVNDPSQGWDGNFRAQIMDPGVYVYVIEVELLGNEIRSYKGDVTLLR